MTHFVTHRGLDILIWVLYASAIGCLIMIGVSNGMAQG